MFRRSWGGAYHPGIPVYLKTNSGHGKKRLHPALEKDEKNLPAFLLHHFFDGVEPLLDPPVLNYRIEGDSLTVTVRFKPDSNAESGRIWWMYDRGIEGSGAYLAEPFPDNQWEDMKSADGKQDWTVSITLDANASHIDFFSNHGKRIEYGGVSYPTYISSPFTRVSLR